MRREFIKTRSEVVDKTSRPEDPRLKGMERLMRKQHRVRNLVINGRGGHAVNEVASKKNGITPKTAEHAHGVRLSEIWITSMKCQFLYSTTLFC